ncbi:MAG: hypothetical protein KGL39_45365 [Patescibacteria group bacterium]|nr:hypothetical protein [Patescibacteria group bacterium]
MPTTKIIITVQGGIVAQVFATEPVDVTVLDCDGDERTAHEARIAELEADEAKRGNEADYLQVHP